MKNLIITLLLSAFLSGAAAAGQEAAAPKKEPTQPSIAGAGTGTASKGMSVVERDRRRHNIKRRAEARRQAELQKAAAKNKKQSAADKGQQAIPAAPK